jgi:hypothetical protein
MKLLRRIVTTAVAFAAISNIASATTIIIGYSTSTGALTTDLSNALLNLPAFDPGGSTTLDTTMGSNVSHSGSGYTSGVTMGSLNDPSMSYTLIGYDITVSNILGGNYSVTQSSAASANFVGSVSLDTYSAVSLGSTLTPPLTLSVDPTNDLFDYSQTGIGTNPPSGPVGVAGEQTSSPGGGPDPSGGGSGSITLTPGQSSGAISVSAGSPVVDLGAELTANANCAATGGYNFTSDCTDSHNYNAYNNGYFIPAGTGPSVSSGSDLSFYLSTITETITTGSGGNFVNTFNLTSNETVTVSYQIDEEVISGAPEPTTMILFGSALVGLGLLRKRAKR